MRVDAYTIYIDEFLKQIPLKGAIIDIACGPGNIAYYALKERPDLRWIGLDGSVKMIEYAKSQNLNAEFKVQDCRTINPAPTIYSSAFCSFLLPYLNQEEVKGLLKSIYIGLKDEGQLYLSTTLEAGAKRDASQNESRQPEYHSEYHIKQWLIEAGYKISSSHILVNALNGDTELILLTKKMSRIERDVKQT
ncbi:MAG: class I SAM-dependent methyltransferase [Saprospiraceae bacterium]|nr:class I SAM-dependent methyltransferase [Saprospiraceae bacterium]